jgi:ATP-binding cassette, subfamily B (MDR/TAP), member 1
MLNSASLRAVVDRKSEIDASDAAGETPKTGTGEVLLLHVAFAYPTRPSVPIFRDLTLRVAAGKVTALVGESGCGKSTVVALVERFYDVARGQVLLDGVDVRQLSLPWLRSQVRADVPCQNDVAGELDTFLYSAHPCCACAQVHTTAHVPE